MEERIMKNINNIYTYTYYPFYIKKNFLFRIRILYIITLRKLYYFIISHSRHKSLTFKREVDPSAFMFNIRRFRPLQRKFHPSLQED